VLQGIFFLLAVFFFLFFSLLFFFRRRNFTPIVSTFEKNNNNNTLTAAQRGHQRVEMAGDDDGVDANAMMRNMSKAATASNLPRATRVKNKSAAPIQITAEQIVREAKERQDDTYIAPRQRITNAEELYEYRLKKRKDFEDVIRRTYWDSKVWTRYAQWEEGQGDFARARSVWERAIDQNYKEVPVWINYAEMEMRAGFVNHARNVWDRACSLLPRYDVLWYKFTHMEETMGEIAACRNVFEKWMKWEPSELAWNAFVNFEMRYKEYDRVRDVYQRYAQVHPSTRVFGKWAKFEQYQKHDNENCRKVFEAGIEMLSEEEDVDDLYVQYAKFEEKNHEYERARGIYKYALTALPKSMHDSIRKAMMTFEKQFGDSKGIENAVVEKRRHEYENLVEKEPMNYDHWFAFAKLEEENGEWEKVREVYERAIGNKPPANEKRYWRRYVYLWINYFLFEELDAKDFDRAREIMRELLKLVPHSEFSFSKVWIMAAKFELRRKKLDAFRKIMGLAIGLAPKPKIFDAYIEIESQLGNVDRCRSLYEKSLELNPRDCESWVKYAELEKDLGETERGRAIFEMAIEQPALDMPENLWKAYIDFEIAIGNRVEARALYERLLEKTEHVKVWMSFAKFENKIVLPPPEDDEEWDEDEETEAERRKREEAYVKKTPTESKEVREQNARKVFERALEALKTNQPDAKEERVMLLEAWKVFEENASGASNEKKELIDAVDKKMPKRVKRKRPMYTEDGEDAGMEEYYDYVFPEEAGAKPNLKLLEAAYAWKKQKQMEASS
jgi:crooked neck